MFCTQVSCWVTDSTDQCRHMALENTDTFFQKHWYDQKRLWYCLYNTTHGYALNNMIWYYVYLAKEEERQNSNEADHSSNRHRVWRVKRVCLRLWHDTGGTLFSVHPQFLQSLRHQSCWKVRFFRRCLKKKCNRFLYIWFCELYCKQGR